MGKRSKNLTEGNIKSQLYKLTWPMLLGMMGIVIFNLVDTYFVGKLGVQELAAMSFTFPIVMILNSLSHGVGVGTSSIISRNIIGTERSEVKMMSSRAILLGVIIVLIFVILGLFTIRPVFSLLGAKGHILDYIEDYMEIWFLGVPFVIIPMIGNNIVRATGDTFTPGMLMVMSGVINIILDPIFIFGLGSFPAMGIKGAALATVIARSSGLIFILIILIRREKLLTIRLGKLRNIMNTWKKVIYIAGPASFAMLITPISIAFITRLLAGFGEEAVAAFGVASRVEMFILMVISALGSVLIIFVGQNLSKHKFDRIYKALNYSMIFSLMWGAGSFIVLLISGEHIAYLFSENTEVVEIAKNYFYIIGASYGFQGLVMLSTAAYNGINKPYPSAIFSIIRMLVLYVPLAWVLSQLFNISGIFWAGLIANIIVGILSFIFLHKSVRKLESKKTALQNAELL